MGLQPSRFYDDLQGLEGWKRKALFAAYYTYVGAWLTVSTRTRSGTNVLTRNWDLLVVLDTCRVDALTAVAEEYDFISSVDSIWSVGSRSDEWLSQTFDREFDETIAETAYVSANPYTHAVFHEGDYAPSGFHPPATWPAWNVADIDDFAVFDEVWRGGTDDDLGVCPPSTVTDRAIRASREADPDRLIVHYMQPHRPYISDRVGESERGTRETGESAADADNETATESRLDPNTKPFAALKAGIIDRDSVWKRYLDNLRLALDSVERLLENVDADTAVITADHGEAFGEYGLYEHPVGCPVPWVRRVPWVETTATDTRASEPTTEPTGDTTTTDEEVTERLADLGYL